MIKAHKIPIFEFIFERYNRWLIKRRFDSVFMSGESNLINIDPSQPVIFCLNHSSWWDGLVAYFLSRRYGFDGFCMMEEKQLTRLRPFTWIGAFSVVRENPREAAASLKYAISLLSSKSNRALWIFPQGEILPNDIRPIVLFDGVEKIAKRIKDCRVVPIALRYEFLGNYKPSVFISVGAAFSSKEGVSTELLETSVTGLLDDIGFAITTRTTDEFKEILRAAA